MRFALNDLCLSLSLPHFFHWCTCKLQVIIAASKIACGQNALVILLPIIIDGLASFLFPLLSFSLLFFSSLFLFSFFLYALFTLLLSVTLKHGSLERCKLKNQSQCKWQVQAKQSHGRSNKEQRLSTVTYSCCVVTVEPRPLVQT